MRDRVQKKRALALERARKEEMVLRLHEDRLIRQEVNYVKKTNGSSSIKYTHARYILCCSVWRCLVVVVGGWLFSDILYVKYIGAWGCCMQVGVGR